DGKPGLEIRLPVQAGLRTIGVAFLRESAKPEVAVPNAGRRGGAAFGAAVPRGPAMQAMLDLRIDGVKVKRFEVPEGLAAPQVTGITLNGPFNITGPGNTPSRARIFVCHPTNAKDEEPCAR